MAYYDTIPTIGGSQPPKWLVTAGMVSFNGNMAIIQENFEYLKEGKIDKALGVVTKSLIAPDAIDASKIEDDAIYPEHLSDDCVTAAAVKEGSISGSIDNSTPVSSEERTLRQGHIAQGTISTLDLRDEAVIASKVKAGEISGSDDNNETTASENHIAHGTISTPDLKDAAVTAGKVKLGEISGTDDLALTAAAKQIKQGTISTLDLKDSAVIGTKIKSGVVSGSNSNSSTATAGHIVQGSISTNDIKNDAITIEKLDSNLVSSATTIITVGDVVESTIGGWSITSISCVKVLGIVFIQGTAKRTGSTITTSSRTGNLVNVHVATLKDDYQPRFESPLPSGSAGTTCSWYINASGELRLAAINVSVTDDTPPFTVLEKDASLTFGGCYFAGGAI